MKKNKSDDPTMKNGKGTMSIGDNVVGKVMSEIFFEAKQKELIYIKPPLVWLEERVIYIKEAIAAAAEIQQTPPSYWYDEIEWLEALIYNMQNPIDESVGYSDSKYNNN